MSSNKDLNNFVYLIYSRSDSEFVEKFSQDLQNKGIRVWLDVEQLKPGVNWVSGLESALEKARAFLYVSSKNTSYSEWASYEVTKSISFKNKPIIPIVIDDIGKKTLPFSLSQYQWADFSNKDTYPKDLEKLVTVLEQYITIDEDIEVSPKISDGYVFISYSSNNSDFVNRLATWLEKQKYGYFDYHTSKRNYHTLFFLELEEKINDAQAVLSILSPDWKSSKWAIREFLYSEAMQKPIFLLQHKTMPPCLLTMGIPYIDFTKSETEGFSELDREIQAKLKKENNT
jgi:hypothetical protein